MAGKGGPKKNEQNKISTKVKLYLISYNILQVLGWSYLLYQIFTHYQSGGSHDTLYEKTKVIIFLFQNAAILEAVHILLKFVKSDFLVTCLQVASRVVVVTVILFDNKYPQQCFGLTIMLVAWCFAEITRYSFYALSLVGSVPYFVTWCRYTFFYVLYPTGVSGEMICYYYCYKQMSELNADPLTTTAYTQFVQYLCVVGAIVYVPTFPKMYLHMVSQRKKIIGGAKSDKKKAS